MNKRIYNILIIAIKYDLFILEEDGRIDEQIFDEYTSLNLRYPPRFTQVSTEEEAFENLKENHYELVIFMPNMDEPDMFSTARHIKQEYADTPIVVLTAFALPSLFKIVMEESKEFSKEALNEHQRIREDLKYSP